MTRVVAYVDGFNLYFGLKSKGWRKYYWLDLPALATSLLKPGQILLGTLYFTSRIRLTANNSQDLLRQNTYIDALTCGGTRVHEGHFLDKPRQCRQCGANWLDYEEKMTDVNIAVRMLSDAFDDVFDTALLVSGDSDLTTPIQQIRSRFPLKRIVVVFPPDRHSKQLQKVATGYWSLSEATLRTTQLPDPVTTATGYNLNRPSTWK